MSIEYKGKSWLKEGFSQPSLSEFVKETREKLARPLTIPAYAAASESDSIEAVSEAFRKNPYANRVAIHGYIDAIISSMGKARPVAYDENPRLYQIAMFASRKLVDMDPVVYLYDAGKDLGSLYNACAISYLDKSYIYVSEQFFREKDMITDEELIFLLGHELGHAQCQHTVLAQTTGKDSLRREYSADRAGMIACGLWLKEHDPTLPAEKIAKRCVRACAGALEKLTRGTLAKMKNQSVDWKGFDYEALDALIEDCFAKARSLPPDFGTHPSHEHRYMAATAFGESELFYQYLGLDPKEYRNLHSDHQLTQAMHQL